MSEDDTGKTARQGVEQHGIDYHNTILAMSKELKLMGTALTDVTLKHNLQNENIQALYRLILLIGSLVAVKWIIELYGVFF